MRRMYTINSKTLMIVPIDIWNTKIIETDQEIILRINYMSIIDFNCKIYGSSYIGRAESSKLLLGINNKLPVIIEESTNMIYFPTASPRNIKCWWIAYSNVVNYIKGIIRSQFYLKIIKDLH